MTLQICRCYKILVKLSKTKLMSLINNKVFSFHCAAKPFLTNTDTLLIFTRGMGRVYISLCCFNLFFFSGVGGTRRNV